MSEVGERVLPDQDRDGEEVVREVIITSDDADALYVAVALSEGRIDLCVSVEGDIEFQVPQAQPMTQEGPSSAESEIAPGLMMPWWPKE